MGDGNEVEDKDQKGEAVYRPVHGFLFSTTEHDFQADGQLCIQRNRCIKLGDAMSLLALLWVPFAAVVFDIPLLGSPLTPPILDELKDLKEPRYKTSPPDPKPPKSQSWGGANRRLPNSP